MIRTIVVAFAGLGIATRIDAHHSQSAFDLAEEIEVAGVVTAYEWANPHVYITIASSADNGDIETWEIEANGISMMRRRGWTADMFAVGDRISVTGNPGKAPASRSILLAEIQRADGTVLEYVAGQFSEPADDIQPASRLNGIWVAEGAGTAWQVFTRSAAMPLTEAGRTALAGYVESRDSNAIDCIPFSLPMLMLLPDIKSFELDERRLVIRSELDATVRTIQLGENAPADMPPADLGHSVGRWDGEALVVTTSGFTAHSQGLGPGLPASEDKRVSERFAINPDRTSFTYTVSVDDPRYLEAPIGGEMIYRYRPDLEFLPAECNLDSARRFLNY